METKKLLTVAEAAQLLGIGRTLAYQLINAGEIRTIRVVKSRRVPRSEVEAYIQRKLEQWDVPTSKASI